MKPYYSDAWTTLYNADCREVLPTIADGTIDFVFTDAPFGHNNNNGDLIHRRLQDLLPTTAPRRTT